MPPAPAVAETGVMGDMRGSPPQPVEKPMPRGVPGTPLPPPNAAARDALRLPIGVDGCESGFGDAADEVVGMLILLFRRSVKPLPLLAGVFGTTKPELEVFAVVDAPDGVGTAGEAIVSFSAAGMVTAGDWSPLPAVAPVAFPLRVDAYATAAALSVFWISFLSDASTNLAFASFLFTSMSGSLF